MLDGLVGKSEVVECISLLVGRRCWGRAVIGLCKGRLARGPTGGQRPVSAEGEAPPDRAAQCFRGLRLTRRHGRCLPIQRLERPKPEILRLEPYPQAAHAQPLQRHAGRAAPISSRGQSGTATNAHKGRVGLVPKV